MHTSTFNLFYSEDAIVSWRHNLGTCNLHMDIVITICHCSVGLTYDKYNIDHWCQNCVGTSCHWSLPRYYTGAQNAYLTLSNRSMCVKRREQWTRFERKVCCCCSRVREGERERERERWGMNACGTSTPKQVTTLDRRWSEKIEVSLTQKADPIKGQT